VAIDIRVRKPGRPYAYSKTINFDKLFLETLRDEWNDEGGWDFKIRRREAASSLILPSIEAIAKHISRRAKEAMAGQSLG
jgi:hypothetical protein